MTLPRARSLIRIGLIAMAVFASGCLRVQRESASPFAVIEMTDLHGDSQRFVRPGRTTVINFWATWCAPCIAEMADLQSLADSFPPNEVLILGVSTDNLPDTSIQVFIDELGIRYPIIVDDGSLDSLAGGIRGLPTTVILDGEGKERHRIMGATTGEELTRLIESIRADGS